MLIEFLQNNKFSRRIIYKAGKARAKDMVSRIEPFLNNDDVILDIGSGTCNACEVLLKKGYEVIPLDVRDLSFVNNISPIIYDGITIPYENDRFDKSLILAVLHHTSNPEEILREAKRVSKGIIIMEDVYLNWIHKQSTYFLDSLLNLEFFGHPHTNKSDKQWKRTFERLGLNLADTKYHKSFLFFRHATYYLEK